MLASAAPTTVPATLSREPRAAAVMAARAPPTTWVSDRLDLGGLGSSASGGIEGNGRGCRSVLMSPCVRLGRGKRDLAFSSVWANAAAVRFVAEGDERHNDPGTSSDDRTPPPRGRRGTDEADLGAATGSGCCPTCRHRW